MGKERELTYKERWKLAYDETFDEWCVKNEANGDYIIPSCALENRWNEDGIPKFESEINKFLIEKEINGIKYSINKHTNDSNFRPESDYVSLISFGVDCSDCGNELTIDEILMHRFVNIIDPNDMSCQKCWMSNAYNGGAIL